MAPFSYKKGREHITDREMEYIACVFLTCIDQIKPNYQLGAEQFGAKQGGFKFGYGAMLRKLKEKGCYIDENEGVKEVKVGIKADKAKSARGEGKKRKDSDEDSNSAPQVKKSRAKKAAVKTEEEAGVEEAEEND